MPRIGSLSIFLKSFRKLFATKLADLRTFLFFLNFFEFSVVKIVLSNILSLCFKSHSRVTNFTGILLFLLEIFFVITSFKISYYNL